jgi:hypothetical protein
VLFTRARLIEAASRETSESSLLRKTMSSRILREAAVKATPQDHFDVFLSHARLDGDLVYGTKLQLESFGFTVYVDWIDDPQLDRSRVTRTTARALRSRMKQCRSLLYVHTENSSTSKWMPWELGYFDGYDGRAAIFPVVEGREDEFKGVEYLGIYPYVDHYRDTNSVRKLWVNRPRSRTVYAPLHDWLDDMSEMRTRAEW